MRKIGSILLSDIFSENVQKEMLYFYQPLLCFKITTISPSLDNNKSRIQKYVKSPIFNLRFFVPLLHGFKNYAKLHNNSTQTITQTTTAFRELKHTPCPNISNIHLNAMTEKIVKIFLDQGVDSDHR